MTKGFDCNIKAAAKGEKHEEKTLCMARMTAYLKRSSRTAGLSTWRGTKRHRVSAKHLTMNLDSQARWPSMVLCVPGSFITLHDAGC